MAYDKSNDYQKRFARWVNHRAIFNSVKWEDYRVNVKTSRQKLLVKEQTSLFSEAI